MFVIKHTVLFIRCRLIRLVSYMYVCDPCILIKKGLALTRSHHIGL